MIISICGDQPGGRVRCFAVPAGSDGAARHRL